MDTHERDFWNEPLPAASRRSTGLLVTGLLCGTAAGALVIALSVLLKVI